MDFQDGDIFIGESDKAAIFSRYVLRENALIEEREHWALHDDPEAFMDSSHVYEYTLSKDELYALKKAATSDKRKIRDLGIEFADSFGSNNSDERKKSLGKLERALVMDRAKTIKSLARQNSTGR